MKAPARPERFITAMRHATPAGVQLVQTGARTSDGQCVTGIELAEHGAVINHSDDSWTIVPWHLVLAVYGTYGVDAALAPVEPPAPSLCDLLGHSFDTPPANGWQTCTACEAAVWVGPGAGPTTPDPDREA